MLTAVKNRLSSYFASGYHAITSTGKRKAASAITKHEDEQLRNRDRHRMIGTGRELNRNFAIFAWVVRKHLDYVTQFDFQMRSDDTSLDHEVEKLMKEWWRPANCDVAGRHAFPKFLRMLEARRTIDGDVFTLKRSNGSLQAIEADLIRQPDRIPPGQRWFNGCHVNNDGRVLRWSLHNREENGQYKFSKFVRASRMCQHANFDRFDQVRGISPLAAAYNSFQDVYEGIDFALAKMKVEQLFAMVVTSADSAGIGEYTKTGNDYDVDFGRGPVKLEMDPGDDAKFLKTDNPGSKTQEFIHTVIGIAMKSLDLPFNFYDESHTNFFGSRAAWLLYDRSCHAKRQDVLELLRKITTWRMQLWIQDGQLQLPRGMTLRDIPFEWVSRGMPWWDPAKEVRGDLEAISAGLDNPYRVCKERGRGEYEDNILQIAKAQEFAEAQGVNVSFGGDEKVQESSEEPIEEDYPEPSNSKKKKEEDYND